MHMMPGMLVWVAEYSNFFSASTVLLVFFLMLIFILRLGGEDMMNTVGGGSTRPAPHPVAMVRVPNPFAMKLVKAAECSLDGVSCSASSQVPWTLQAYWGASVKELHRFLLAKWPVFKNIFNEDGLLKEGCLQRGELKSFTECSELEIPIIPIEKLEEGCLGPVPRSRYPLVVIMLKQDETEEIVSDESITTPEVGAMVNIFHIQDSICKQESCIIMQYLKQTNGQVGCLQPLYVNTEDENSVHTDDNVSTPPEISMCAVCQTEPVTRALLPCRHTCICAGCFPHVDKCPMCRSPINSYFCIREEAIVQDPRIINLQELNWRQRVEHYMNRANTFFGFT